MGTRKTSFISSVMGELAEERQSAASGIRSAGLRAVLFEEFGGRDANPEGAYLQKSRAVIFTLVFLEAAMASH